MRPGERLTVAEAAARAGVTPARVERIRLASGLPPVAMERSLRMIDQALGIGAG